MARAWMLAAVLGGLAAGCTIKVNASVGACDDEERVAMEDGGAEPLVRQEEIQCARSLSAFPLPPAQPIGARVDLELPDGARLRQVSVTMTAALGHVALPARMPGIEMAVAPAEDSTAIAIVGTSVDPSATVADYETPHEVEIPMVDTKNGITVDTSTTVYAVIAIGEGGENALPLSTFSGWACLVDLP